MKLRIKRIVIFSLALTWSLFIGHLYLESKGELENAQEHKEQSIEHILASPIETVSANQITFLKISSDFFSIPILHVYPKFALSKPTLENFLIAESPPRNSLPLYKLYSVYRL